MFPFSPELTSVYTQEFELFIIYEKMFPGKEEKKILNFM